MEGKEVRAAEQYHDVVAAKEQGIIHEPASRILGTLQNNIGVLI
jgi:hypothetical protein